jgi:hypothetical protein
MLTLPLANMRASTGVCRLGRLAELRARRRQLVEEAVVQPQRNEQVLVRRHSARGPRLSMRNRAVSRKNPEAQRQDADARTSERHPLCVTAQ